jgi:hypothetical protein
MRTIRLVAGSVVVALLMPAAAASAVQIAPPDQQAFRNVGVAAGAHGSALVTWRTTSTVRAAMRSSGGRFGAPQMIAGPPLVPILAQGPLYASLTGAGATVLFGTTTGAAFGAQTLLVRRAGNAASFAAPVSVFANAQTTAPLASASNARGDIAAVISIDRQTELITARAGRPFGAPQVIPDVNLVHAPAIAVGRGGQIVVAYATGGQELVREGEISGALGAPALLGPGNLESSVAIDAGGTATVGWTRFLAHRVLAAYGARAASGHRFGHSVKLTSGRNLATLTLASGGTTTAATWQSFGGSHNVHVALAHGVGAFRFVESLATPDPSSGTFENEPFLDDLNAQWAAGVSVDAQGDVLVLIRSGPFNGLYVRMLRAGATRFGGGHVVSGLAGSLGSAVTLLDNRQPLVAYASLGAVYATSSLTGPAPDPHRPVFRLGALQPTGPTTDGGVSLTVRCAHACAVEPRAIFNGDSDTHSDSVFPNQIAVPSGHTTLHLRPDPAFLAKLDPGEELTCRVDVLVANATGTGKLAETAEKVVYTKPGR